MSTEGYLGNDKLKRVGIDISFTEEEAKEILKCSEDPIYFIRKYVKIHEMSPTYREMVKALNSKSVSNIGRMLDALAEDGKITRRIPAKPRSIKIL